MTVSPFDHPYLSGFLGDDEIAGQFSVEEDEERMFYFEEALSRALAEEGIIPEAAKEIYPVAPFVPDRERLRAAVARDGVVGPEYVRQLRDALGSPAGDHVHFGATSQDLVDTALILRLRPVLDICEERLQAFASALALLEGRFGDNSLMAVTRMQDALPTTVSDRIAAWHGPIPRHLDRLKDLRPRLIVLQFGGAVGVLDKLGGKGMAVARRVAEKLDLRLPEHSWHNQRDNIAEFASWLSLVAGSLGKFGQDVALMALAGDITLRGGGGSSAMPHKQNPVKAEALVALARYAAILAPAMHQAQVHEFERSGAAWTLEWLALPQLVMTTGTALRIAGELAASIEGMGSGVDASWIGRAVRGLAGAVALAGGIVLIVITTTTVLSIVGRILIPLGLKPIQGDVEIVQAGMLFAILCFLPWAHLTRGHAIVAILTDRFPTRFNAILEFLMDVLMLAVAVFIIWRFQAGLLDKIANRESSFILRYPIWWSYAAGLLGLGTFVIVAIYCVVRSGRNALSPNPVRPLSEMGE